MHPEIVVVDERDDVFDALETSKKSDDGRETMFDGDIQRRFSERVERKWIDVVIDDAVTSGEGDEETFDDVDLVVLLGRSTAAGDV